MIKKFYASLFFLLIVSSAYAESDWNIKARIGAFVPVNARFQGIYGYGGPDFELEASKALNKFEFWGNINWNPKNGRSIGFSNFTYINIANFSLGPKYVYCLPSGNQLYAGLGAVISGVWLKNHTSLSDRYVSKAVFGSVLKLGFNYYCSEHVFIDLFADYYYLPVHFHTHVDVGGLKTGIGLGYSF